MSARHKFDGLLSQWDMLENVIQSRWAKLIDVKVAQVIIDKYYKSKGLTSVSIRQIAEVTGKQHKYICPSIHRLVDRGVISVARLGAGKRASEYSLNFGIGKNPSVVTADTASSGVHVDTALGVHMDTTNTASGVTVDTNPCLDNRPIGRLILSSTSPAVPTAPPLAGLTPASADSAVGLKKTKTPFDEIWQVWPLKTKGAEARKAYGELHVDENMHSEILAAAKRWAENYRTNETEPQFVKRLHNWLRDGCYEENPPPQPYTKKAKVTKSSEAGETKNLVGLSPKTPIGIHEVEITGTEFNTHGEAFNLQSKLRVNFQIRNGKHKGRSFSHAFYLTNESEKKQEAGQQFFTDIRKATRTRDDIDDTAELHGKTLFATVSNGGRIKYNNL